MTQLERQSSKIKHRTDVLSSPTNRALDQLVNGCVVIKKVSDYGRVEKIKPYNRDPRDLKGKGRSCHQVPSALIFTGAPVRCHEEEL
ncbi:uncharacterized protein PADG_12246 [Paracoccidioides brasiliensis Pb18]|uniref:Uncharacterized protein n=1 Tax=Paracoccidioides brasiliensis (strain Pb18) TaxID=502780 RepID=A0A0A0HR51_PARBD|nr:uncharacterized protein PADG_12246 [Paracoccidioides brasiliensis Pb18]KGM91674.1 hypothetical protein PADG_12246 [Paracoccidioides brasiliensis Pb18]